MKGANLIFFLSLLASPADAFDFPLYDGAGGATCEFFNLQARIPWQRKQGDWIDAAGVPFGNAAFARAPIRNRGRDAIVEWDVTELIRRWLNGTAPEQALLLRPVPRSRSGIARFHSREAVADDVRPRLVLEFANARREILEPIADTQLQCSTHYSLGELRIISAGSDSNLLLQFDVATLRDAPPLIRATLVLTATAKQQGNPEIGVYRLAPPALENMASPEWGLAARHPGDRGLENEPDVLLATGFESPAWEADWSYVNPSGTQERITESGGLGFEPLEGAALKVRIPGGKHLGLDIAYKFADKKGAEPDEIYFRYYLRLASDWDPANDGGKLPGLSATYGQAGWGGRRTNGMDGWSMRGSFSRRPSAGNPYRDLTMIGSYVYHPDAADLWGDVWPWSRGQRGLLERNRWYCIEQYVKLNRPGQKDAIFRAWVDGRLAFERTDFRLRESASIHIEQVWMNVYFGGTNAALHDQHLFIDNVVIARRYIGPLSHP
jgi:hypothetical protein